MRNIILSIGMLAATTSIATAQTSTPRVDARQDNQERRIQQGVGSGQLTARETYQLEKGQVRVNKLENRAKADGVVTNAERARLQQAQNVQSQRIYNKKHNGRQAY
jgi:hypothetical protein